jgi:hypothetical protein
MRLKLSFICIAIASCMYDWRACMITRQRFVLYREAEAGETAAALARR